MQKCLLRPVFNGAVFGEAGTIFLDKKLFDELDRNRISASSVDRYTTVVMAGIAAEGMYVCMHVCMYVFMYVCRIASQPADSCSNDDDDDSKQPSLIRLFFIHSIDVPECSRWCQ